MEAAVSRLPFWQLLTEQERDTVQRSAMVRRYEKGALIHGGGSECLGLLLVLSGEIRTYLLSDEGREVTVPAVPRRAVRPVGVLRHQPDHL